MPDGAQFAPWAVDRASAIISASPATQDQLLPLLHALQAEFGYVADGAVPLLAAALNLSRAEVHGVLTFYRDFRRTPPQGRVVSLCRAEACQARGGRETARVLENALTANTKNAGPSVTLEPAYCLGLCASGPAALVDGRPVARLNGARLDRLVAELVS